MDQLQEIFFQEARELLAELEQSLLDFEQDLGNKNSIETIFRSLHTLKGSSGMFGFHAMNEFTHELENIFEEIRSGKSQASPKLLEICLVSLDHLKALLEDHELKDESNAARQLHLLKQIEELHGSKEQASSSIHIVEEKNDLKSLFYIQFKPGNDLISNGTNPLYLIDDLCQLGKSWVITDCSRLPELKDFVADQSYLSFEIVLWTSSSIAEVNDVFLFAEGLATITIEKVAEDQPNESFIFLINEAIKNEKSIGIEAVHKALLKDEKSSQPDTLKTQSSSTQIKERSSGSSIRVSSEKLDELMNLVSELVTSQAQLSMHAETIAQAQLSGIVENMEKITRRLRDNAFSICLLPIDTLTIRFQRLVRDASKELGKEIQLLTEGTDTELDKSVIENLSDPILHLIRNCVDHGIESLEKRQTNGKPRLGTIMLKSWYSGTKVFIEISDDGAGINKQKVRQKAIENGLITEDTVLNEQQLYDVLFMPGFSTAASISELSGRGVGMDVVKRKIQELKGSIEISSIEGQGSRFTIGLPLTLSIIDGLLVQVDQATYVIPMNLVDKCYEKPAALLQNRVQFITLDGERTPVYSLRDVFGISNQAPEILQIIKVFYDQTSVGLAVDHIIGEHQVVLKPLGSLYHGHNEYSGATILGDGTVALVFDTNTLFNKLIENSNIYGNKRSEQSVLSHL